MEEAPSRGGASDIFDSVLNLESTFIQKGRAEANSDKKSVDLDAYDTGKRYGEEIGYELGFISGVVSVLEERAMVEEHSSTPARQERALRTVWDRSEGRHEGARLGVLGGGVHLRKTRFG